MDTITPDSISSSARTDAPVGFFTLVRTRSEWRVALLMAVIAAAIYQVFVFSVLDAYIADRSGGAAAPVISGFITALLIMACAAVAAVYHPRSTWRWGLTVAIAPSVVVVLRIVFDSVLFSPSLHNLFPFEAMMVFFLTVPPAFIGASVGSFIGKTLGRHHE